MDCARSGPQTACLHRGRPSLAPSMFSRPPGPASRRGLVRGCAFGIVPGLVRGGGYDGGRDNAGGYGGQDIVAVNLAPLVAARRLLQVIGAVVDGLATVPILFLHAGALLPLFVADVGMVVGVVMFGVGRVV